MTQRASNDELEVMGLYLVCKNCGSPAIKEITGEDKSSVDMCRGCGVVDFTKVISEDEYMELQKRETV